VRFVLGPHAIYTDSKSTLKSCSELARDQGKRVQIHISETATEVEDCVKAHGMRPVEYLDSIGFWGPEVLAVHAVHLNDHERHILRDHEVSIAHCPASNMKLCSGNFAYAKAAEAGIRLTLGTDGASSNNDLSMLEEMKLAALWAKSLSGDPTAASAEDIFHMATRNGAEWAGLDAGKIREGRLADCILLRRDHHTVAPSDHFISDLVYSADNESIDTVICGGVILMRDRAVKGEDEIVARAKETYGDLIKR
jgi:5-methylthioadenosine/S-adenosylhomocysteine deaminase